MRKGYFRITLTVFLLLAGCLNATANVSIDWQALDVTGSDGTTEIPVGALWILVIDTSANGFGSIIDGATINAFDAQPTTQSDDRILRVGAVDAGDAPGWINIGATTNIALTAISGWGAGDPLALFWFPTYTTATAIATTGDAYGTYRTDSAVNGGDPWVTPSDGNSASCDPLVTISASGSQANSLGAASLTVVAAVPEPSILALLGIGSSFIGFWRFRLKK